MKSRSKNKRNKRKSNNKVIPSYGLGSWLKGAISDVGEFTGADKVADWAGDRVGKGIRSGVKDVTGFAADVAGDFYTGIADVGLGALGAGDVIGKDAYETGVGREAGEIASKYIAPVAGQVAATAFLGPMAGQALGTVQQGVGPAVGQGEQQQLQQQALQQQQQMMNKQNLVQQRLQSYNQGQGNRYAPTFKSGGVLNSYPNGGKLNSYAGGGNIQELTRYNDDITSYQSGGSTHEESPYGGIPIGRKGTVEHGEFRYGDYIFSNRF